MIKIENVVLPSPEQMEIIISGMRNPKNSWDKSDSYMTYIEDPETLNTAQYEFFVGDNDWNLMTNLSGAGSAHAKFKRMMMVYCTITAPRFWWTEWDTYLHTVRNSCSTMHKLVDRPLTMDDFSTDKISFMARCTLSDAINIINRSIDEYKVNPTRETWDSIIHLLPQSYNQKATVMMNYETLTAMYRWRRDHKLSEWQTFCDWIESLPYSDLITGGKA